MEQLQQIQLLLFVQRDSRYDLWLPECRIRLLYDSLEIGRRDIGAGNVTTKYPECQVLEG